MRFTFGEAKRILAGTAHSKAVDIGGKINDAIRALVGANPWEHEFLRQTLRISSAGPEFSLPQGSAGLVRACLNGRPVSLHGEDFKFLSSGPGDIDFDRLGRNYIRLSAQEIEDLGMSPVWRQPGPEGGHLAATYSGDKPQAEVTVHAVSDGGDEVTFRLLPSNSEDLDYDLAHEVRYIRSIVLDRYADEYIDIHLTPDGGDTDAVIARCHPSIQVPEFHIYRVNRVRPGDPCEILAEVQVDPLPLIDDADVLPFPTLEPIKCMMLYQWNFQNNETAAAEKYLNQAMSWITRFNSAKNTVQTPTVVNVPYNMSMGQLSDWCSNL